METAIKNLSTEFYQYKNVTSAYEQSLSLVDERVGKMQEENNRKFEEIQEQIEKIKGQCCQEDWTEVVAHMKAEIEDICS